MLNNYEKGVKDFVARRLYMLREKLPDAKEDSLYSTKVFSIYNEFFEEKDIHYYSIDEVFINVTDYLKYYKKIDSNDENFIEKIQQFSTKGLEAYKNEQVRL